MRIFYGKDVHDMNERLDSKKRNKEAKGGPRRDI